MASSLSPVEASAGSIASSRREISERWPGWMLDRWAERMEEGLEGPRSRGTTEAQAEELDARLGGRAGGTPITPPRPARSLERIALRTRFFDNFLSVALRGPLNQPNSSRQQQALLLAVGGDMRTHRLEACKGVKVLEVDLPEVARRRRTVLAELKDLPERDAVCVEADVTDADFMEILAAAGLNMAASTVTLAEGLLYYLDESCVKEVLGRLSRLGGVICFSAVGEKGASRGTENVAESLSVPRTAKRQLSSLFKWRCGDPAQFAKAAGWKHARAFQLGAADGGCGGFEEFLEESGENMEERRKDGETFYVVAAMEDARFWPFSDPAFPPPGFEDSRRAAVVVCGKALREGRASAELTGRVRRANQLFHALAAKGSSPDMVLSGGRGEAAAMEEILRGLGNETASGVREEESGNTRENARLAMDQIAPGVEVLYVVTSSYHLPRAVRAFEREAARRGWRGEVRGFGDFWTVAQSRQRHEDEHVDMAR
jgi:methyltransferase (TIGR00027 family)